MRMSRSREHLDDEHLLAYLDGETDNKQTSAIRSHLDLCWGCRSALAELEAQAEAVSRLLTERSNNAIARSVRARDRFLQWRDLFEARRRFFSIKMPPQIIRNFVREVHA
jgi:anti-sigma factor RsiW